MGLGAEFAIRTWGPNERSVVSGSDTRRKLAFSSLVLAGGGALGVELLGIRPRADLRSRGFGNPVSRRQASSRPKRLRACLPQARGELPARAGHGDAPRARHVPRR